MNRVLRVFNFAREAVRAKVVDGNDAAVEVTLVFQIGSEIPPSFPEILPVQPDDCAGLKFWFAHGNILSQVELFRRRFRTLTFLAAVFRILDSRPVICGEFRILRFLCRIWLAVLHLGFYVSVISYPAFIQPHIRQILYIAFCPPHMVGVFVH